MARATNNSDKELIDSNQLWPRINIEQHNCRYVLTYFLRVVPLKGGGRPLLAAPLCGCLPSPQETPEPGRALLRTQAPVAPPTLSRRRCLLDLKMYACVMWPCRISYPALPFCNCLTVQNKGDAKSKNIVKGFTTKQSWWCRQRSKRPIACIGRLANMWCAIRRFDFAESVLTARQLRVALDSTVSMSGCSARTPACNVSAVVLSITRGAHITSSR